MEIIRCEGLSKIYQAGENKVFALDNVDLTIEQGSFTAITGPSGSGKSTLLHLLSGLDTPSKGRVIYQGKNLYDYKDNQLSVLRRRRFGFVFQSYNLVRELTGWAPQYTFEQGLAATIEFLRGNLDQYKVGQYIL